MMRRAPLLITLLATGLVCVPRGPAQAREEKLQDHQHVWARLGFEGRWLLRETSDLLLSERIDVGNRGFIYDPALATYDLTGGLNQYHINSGTGWGHSFGWGAGIGINAFPLSMFPMGAWFRYLNSGFAPGGIPSANFLNAIDTGGRLMLIRPGWPRFLLTGNHYSGESFLQLFGQAKYDPGPTTWKRTTITTSLHGRSGGHSYVVHAHFRDQTYDETSRARQFGFAAGDRTGIAPNVMLEGRAAGWVGQAGDVDLVDVTNQSDYTARLGLRWIERNKLRLFARNVFHRTSFGGDSTLSDSLVGEFFYILAPWIELFGGLALTYAGQDDETSSFARDVFREELGTGAHVNRRMLGGLFRGRAVVRLGMTQVLDSGNGLLFVSSSDLSYSRRLGPGVSIGTSFSAQNRRDNSPVGGELDRLLLQVIASWSTSVAVSGTGRIFASHTIQNEPVAGTLTDSYTNAGTWFHVSYSPLRWLWMALNAGYANYFVSELGVDHSLYGGAEVTATAMEDLLVSGAAYYTRSMRANADALDALRVDGRLTYALRQFRLSASYRYLLDDYRGLGGGDHQLFFSLTRRFDIRWGSAR